MANLNQEMDLKYVKSLLKKKNESQPKPRQRALVMVLGDIGHSPRMQYHVSSLVKEGFDVDFVGFRHSEPRAEILKSPAVEIKVLSDVPAALRGFPRLLYYPIKVVWLVLSLLWTMWNLQSPDLILIQNPPTIPVVFCAFLANYYWQAAVVVDWHNYSHTILAMNLKRRGLLQRFLLAASELAEKVAAQYSDLNLCVTKAMAADMKRRWNANATTLYDRPPDDFGTFDSMEGRHFLFMKLGGVSSAFRSEDVTSTGTETAFTKKDLGKGVSLKANRPVLLVSSTSWTEDEDFGLLFDALKLYDDTARKSPEKYPKILLVVTGKGPLKDFYMSRVKQEPLETVAITSFWLETADYPRLLGSADLGVCLHFSSSSLDLPMKVVDMFGCGIPVCAVKYDCIEELVQPNSNGLLFTSPDELCQQFLTLLAGFPNTKSNLLARLKAEVQTFRQTSWHSNWMNVAEPVLTAAVERRKRNVVPSRQRLAYALLGLALLIVPFVLSFQLLGSVFGR
ncbi:UDP-glycosyltransferase TURAN [Hypsibius exemplaris]|uniref:UDP-glycosyltransferase TURAN n=1 Tax=Hypsibius exemplaris TaxID=2072580 RepID=A0A1W0WWM5_HYPEX|nr:UDP-glycosyltransferase TURAN [Hypsibius exemplaris]